MNTDVHPQSTTPRVGFPLLPGDILIPCSPYQFCLRVDAISPDCEWADPGYVHTTSTRYDIDEQRDPIFKHRDDLHVHLLRYVGHDVFRDFYSQNSYEPRLPMYFRKWKPRRGQLQLF